MYAEICFICICVHTHLHDLGKEIWCRKHWCAESDSEGRTAQRKGVFWRLYYTDMHFILLFRDIPALGHASVLNIFHECYVDLTTRICICCCNNKRVMGLLPDTQNRGCACAGNAGNVFPVTAGKRSRHASRHVRHARAVMHAGIAN